MKARELRQSFLDFFESKQHTIVPSAPMVVKDDPTLMFTNAGMNQFKDKFLGNSPITSPRVADSQKCLRVSGKHNDLEEVGHDTYHHTMFEMLGNWSFGNYFKKEAIAWAWEYLTSTLRINPEILYATVFEGDKKDGTEFDQEAYDFWREYLPEERILMGNKKDNFWEMGDQGPCGPCSELHVDIRTLEEKAKVSGAELVNMDHPQVIEIWNLVFIQFNRKANGDLETLPDKHIDTGMGFERLAMVVQGKQSNYDTDVFQPLLKQVASIAKTEYGKAEEQDIAMRVISDHIRTISFAIADGQLPSNMKAGYVIRRILRRAVRYGYTFLNLQEPFLYQIVPALIDSMGEAYPELVSQEQLITKVIFEEEKSFLRTLATGINLLDTIIEKTKTEGSKIINGVDAFTLYDTYGFPYDLTTLIAREQGLEVDEEAFTIELNKQKDRARKATTVSTTDWVELEAGNGNSFIGYDATESTVSIIKYRKVTAKKQELYQLVFNNSPFYAESGGQVGDTGYIEANGKKTFIIDTQKENNLIIHIVKELPESFDTEFVAYVNKEKRNQIASNHTATHLLHFALQKVLGTHVEQKGSLVETDKLRFDFSHFEKMTAEEIRTVEQMVNAEIRKNISLNEHRDTPIAKANEMGAKALFGEKYGDTVRVIQFGDSIELCGGTHADSTGKIGFFKIISEGAIAAGIRRIEAITSEKAEAFIYNQIDTINEVKEILKNPKDISKQVSLLNQENSALRKQIEAFEKEKAIEFAKSLQSKISDINGVSVLIENITLENPNLKDIASQVKNSTSDIICVLANGTHGKVQLAITISDSLVNKYSISAQELIKLVSKEIQGGGGGQAVFATAGGKNVDGISKALEIISQTISQKLQ